ncbi:P-loop NTPase family protein [Thalassococcus lentus]|uniref:DnaA/Hda family protein n=1 Tax=Thalassococcus lentus TaxID=1210524 RepID=A0ABT4XY19_9RHOB|nr:DnaA/Hda family protein [Thalassococcus lentus]MDA7426740.1 DnaA/Hda family protein [Thalassococcus lentus]
MSDPRQLPLPLPVRTALGREDFFVTPANAMAVALVEGWQNWPARKFILTGPSGSGKTHLAHVWAALSGATIIRATDLPNADIPAVSTSPVCVEDVEQIAGNSAAEEALFHLHNLVLAEGHALLLTAQNPALQWDLVLPDLKSRMLGAQGADLPQPDDMLLTALLAKLFADRQIVPSPDVIPFLAGHMPRSYAAALELVHRLDRAALGRGGGVTRPLARSVLAELEQDGPTRHD